MYKCLILQSRTISNVVTKKLKITCNHADLLAWGMTPTDHDNSGVSKAEMNRMKTQFYNSGQRRCTLCDEYLEASFSAHSSYVGHLARVGILERAISMLQKEMTSSDITNNTNNNLSIKDRTKNLLDNWWKRLNDVEKETMLDYKRITSLSSSNSKHRLWRVRFLLEFLRDREVIRDSLTAARIMSSGDNCFVRTKRFERSEMIGDNIVKVVVPDRLVRLFPANEGGVSYRIACIQQLLDSNEGLLQIYDYIDLNAIIGVRLPNNKTKSDVVESLFGELQTFLWASEIACGVDQFPAIPTAEHRYIKALVNHLLNELTHMVIMWRIEKTLDNAKEFIEERFQRNKCQNRNMIRNENGSIIIKETEYDRSRYALLPLLLKHPYLTSSSSTGGKSEQYSNTRKPFTRNMVYYIQSIGTPIMLFSNPIPKPDIIKTHYKSYMRIVDNVKEYSREVLNVLLKENNMMNKISTSEKSINNRIKFTENNKCGKLKEGQQQLRYGTPFGELAAEKYPTWGDDVRISELRQSIEEKLKKKSVYINTIDWNNLINSLTKSLSEGVPLPTLKLHEKPKVTPSKLQSLPVNPLELTESNNFTTVKLKLVEEMFIPPLSPTIH